MPGLAAVIRALNDLPEPTAALGRKQPIRISRRSLDMINLPTGKMRTANVPSFALRVRGQNERPFPCTNQHSYFAHLILPVDSSLFHNSFLTSRQSRSRF